MGACLTRDGLWCLCSMSAWLGWTVLPRIAFFALLPFAPYPLCFLLPLGQGHVLLCDEGLYISWRTLIASRLEAVRPEMSPSMWVIACSSVLACPYPSIIPSQLLSLWTSNHIIIYKDCSASSHNSMWPNPYLLVVLFLSWTMNSMSYWVT